MIKASLLGLLKLYKIFVSPLFGACCRFYPSCSDYAYRAIETHGIIKGVFLGILRVLKCHPFHQGGYDPVPEKFGAKIKWIPKD